MLLKIICKGLLQFYSAVISWVFWRILPCTFYAVIIVLSNHHIYNFLLLMVGINSIVILVTEDLEVDSSLRMTEIALHLGIRKGCITSKKSLKIAIWLIRTPISNKNRQHNGKNKMYKQRCTRILTN